MVWQMAEFLQVLIKIVATSGVELNYFPKSISATFPQNDLIGNN